MGCDMKILISLHGVRSGRKNWQDDLGKYIKDSGRKDLMHVPYKYGWIPAFLSIFPFYQRHCIKKFSKWLKQYNLTPNIYIISHSFGTFIGFHGSNDIEKLILFGSILHCRENFDRIVPNRIKEIHNFHSTTDEVCMLNPIGHSGAWGFRNKRTKSKIWRKYPYPKNNKIINHKSIASEHTEYFPLYFPDILKLL